MKVMECFCVCSVNLTGTERYVGKLAEEREWTDLMSFKNE